MRKKIKVIIPASYINAYVCRIKSLKKSPRFLEEKPSKERTTGQNFLLMVRSIALVMTKIPGSAAISEINQRYLKCIWRNGVKQLQKRLK